MQTMAVWCSQPNFDFRLMALANGKELLQLNRPICMLRQPEYAQAIPPSGLNSTSSRNVKHANNGRLGLSAKFCLSPHGSRKREGVAPTESANLHGVTTRLSYYNTNIGRQLLAEQEGQQRKHSRVWGSQPKFAFCFVVCEYAKELLQLNRPICMA